MFGYLRSLGFSVLLNVRTKHGLKSIQTSLLVWKPERQVVKNILLDKGK